MHSKAGARTSSAHRAGAIHRRLEPAGTGLRPFPARRSGARRDRRDRHRRGIGQARACSACSAASISRRPATRARGRSCTSRARTVRCSRCRIGTRSRTGGCASSASRSRWWWRRPRSRRRTPPNGSWSTIAICRRWSSRGCARARRAAAARRCAGQPALDYEYGSRDAGRCSVRQGGAGRARHARGAAHRRQPDGAEVGLGAYDPERRTASTCTCRPRAWPTSWASSRTSPASPSEKFRVHAQDVGGGFGVRNEVYPEFVAVLSRRRTLGRPVKWIGTRSEIARERPSRARRHADRRARPRPRRQLPRAARRVAGRYGRLLLECRPVHQHRGVADQHGGQRLPHRRRSTGCTGWFSPTPRRAPPIAAPAGPACRI